MKKFFTISSLTLGMVAAFGAQAEDENPLDLDKVTVSANRTSKSLDEITNKASVITAEEIEKHAHNDIKDLVRYEPGVVVSGVGRFGLSGFNIRGIGGDRVLTLVDGAPVADEFSFGPALSARRNYIDVDSLKAVEIIRGPASSLYGSNAIGGLVTFLTKDPNDYLGSERGQYLSLKTGFDSVDSSFDNTLTFATGNERVQGMFIGTHRKSDETETYFTHDDSSGSGRKSANPIENTETNMLAKLAFQANENHEFKMTAEKFDAKSDTSALSQAGTVVFGTLKQTVNAEDTKDRSRLGFEYLGFVDTILFDQVNFNLYSQDSETHQNTFETRLSPAQVQETRTRESLYQQKNTGIKTSFVKDIDNSISQQWVFGFDYDNSKIKSIRYGQTVDVITGNQLPEHSNFPTRDFPNSDYTSYGFFVQNELSFLDDKLILVPSLRYDNFKLKPKVDDIYLSGNTGSPTPTPYTESEISAKLGGLYYFNDKWSLFGQFAEGFKAPPIDAVNTGFTNFAGGYTTLPNTDLNPESSETVELGLRYKGESHQFELSAYRNAYDDFIETTAFKGFNPVTGLLEFQARNLDKATIDGFELRGFYDISKIYQGIRLQYAYAKSSGVDETTQLPINSVQPQSFVAGIGYDSPTGIWGSELILTVNKRKTDIDDSAIQPTEPSAPAVEAFQTPGYNTLDWLGYYNFKKNVSLNWGVFNLSDKQYWQWNDVLVQEAASNQLSRLTQPGRNASVSLKIEF